MTDDAARVRASERAALASAAPAAPAALSDDERAGMAGALLLLEDGIRFSHRLSVRETGQVQAFVARLQATFGAE